MPLAFFDLSGHGFEVFPRRVSEKDHALSISGSCGCLDSNLESCGDAGQSLNNIQLL